MSKHALILIALAASVCACSPAVYVQPTLVDAGEVICKEERELGSRRVKKVCTTAAERGRLERRADRTLRDEQVSRGEPITQQ